MQQQEVPPPNDVQPQEPDWELATYARRMGAWALDFVGFALPLILLIIIGVLTLLGVLLSTFEIVREGHLIDPRTGAMTLEERTVESITKFGGQVLSDETAGTLTVVLISLVVVTLIVMLGYIVWWLFALGRGQTPGKQIVGIRVIKDDGTPSGWGYTFLREFVIKFLLLNLLSEPTFGIARLVDYLWPLWDRAEKMQTLHDKMLGTIVVKK